jgi:hypothetical protein
MVFTIEDFLKSRIWFSLGDARHFSWTVAYGICATRLYASSHAEVAAGVLVIEVGGQPGARHREAGAVTRVGVRREGGVEMRVARSEYHGGASWHF